MACGWHVLKVSKSSNTITIPVLNINIYECNNLRRGLSLPAYIMRLFRSGNFLVSRMMRYEGPFDEV